MSEVEELSWVLRGKQRREIIKHIDGQTTPSEVARKSGYSLNHTSRVLNDLRKKGLAQLLNPDQKTGRLYELNSKGKRVRDSI